MSTQPSNANLQLYLLSIRGTLAPATLEAARGIHNATAGHPQSVAAAQQLGDLSHMVWVPTEQHGAGAGEFLILDVWKSMDGLNAFFANPTVQEQAGQIFSTRAPAVWLPADSFTSFHLPVPTGMGDRFVGVAQGPVPSHAAAMAIHNAVIAANASAVRKRGIVSHDAYVRLAAPGSPEALDMILIDVWASEAGMQEHYEDPLAMQGFHGLFSAEPSSTTWQHPAGSWVEW